MRSGVRIASLALVLLALCAGCARRRHPVLTPPRAEAPSLPSPADTAAMMPPLPVLPPYPERPVLLNTSVPPETREPSASRRRILRRRAKPEVADNHAPGTDKSAQQPGDSADVASAPPSAMTPIGQLSTASGDDGPTDRAAIAGLIKSTEKGLAAFRHPLNARDQKTAAQIRTFLAHARDSLKSNDLDGARTLAVKAHLLLQELTRE